MLSRSLGRKLLAIMVAAMLVVSAAAAQEAGFEAASEASEEHRFPEFTSLWKVETDSSVVYLMGSIHLLKKEDLPLHPKMEKVFKEVPTVVFEIEIDSAATQAFQQHVFFTALYESGKTLRTELGDSLYSMLRTAMTPLGLDIEQMKQFEPWMVAITFLALNLQELGFDPEFGVDKYFYEKAMAEEKEILALETPGYQIDLFDSMPESDQRSLILQAIEQAEDIEEMLDEIILHWKTGNLEGLEATINKSLAGYPRIRDRLLGGRNLGWMQDIESFIGSRGRYLVIVGVAHMSGEKGLIELLKRAGYEVQQM